MATKAEIETRARQIIESDPTSGKQRVNKILRMEFGKGLRSATILKLKREVASEHPALLSQLYERGGVDRGLNKVYAAWIKSGFMPFEARELTVGHGVRYRSFDAQAVYDSGTGQAARHSRIDLIKQLRDKGWTNEEIRQHIIDFYRKSKTADVWTHIRAEYVPRKRIDFVDYRDAVRRRARAKQRRLGMRR